jgi:hypothetical protein
MVISDNKSDRKNIELYDIPQVHYGMQLVENELLKVISKSDTMICEIIKGLLNTGKKIRPKLVIISGMCFDELNEKWYTQQWRRNLFIPPLLFMMTSLMVLITGETNQL